MILNASYVCLHAFSIRRESPDPDLERRTPHFWGGSITPITIAAAIWMHALPPQHTSATTRMCARGLVSVRNSLMRFGF
jgi:hypothetical protein